MVNKVEFEEFEQRVRKKYSSNFSFKKSDYTTVSNPITIKCEKHQTLIPLRAASHLTFHNPCKQCIRDEKFEVYKPKVYKSLRENYPQFKLLDEIKDFNCTVRLLCPKHGVFKKTTDKIIFKGFGCSKCGWEKASQTNTGSQRVSFVDFETRFVERYGNRLTLVSTEEEYQNFKSVLTAKCSDPSHPLVKKTAMNFLRSNGCISCKESVGERLTRLALEELNLEYVQEKRFASCRYKKELPFDFWLPKFTALIEFQGKQHEISSKRFGGIKTLRSTQRRDKIKKEWAEQNGVNLIYVTDYNNIKEQILKNLKSNKTYDVKKVLRQVELNEEEWNQEKWNSYLKRLNHTHKGRLDFSKSSWTMGSLKIEYICIIHGERSGFLHALLKGHGCNRCAGHETNLEEIIARSREKFGNKFDFSESVFRGTEIEMEIRCATHGIIKLTPENHFWLSKGCKLCSKKADDYSPKNFLRKAKDKFGKRFDYSDLGYIDSSIKVTIRCLKHDHIFNILPGGHLKSITGGCKFCVLERIKETRGKKIKVEGTEYQSIKDAAEFYGLKSATVRARLHLGWDIETALKTPKMR